MCLYSVPASRVRLALEPYINFGLGLHTTIPRYLVDVISLNCFQVRYICLRTSRAKWISKYVGPLTVRNSLKFNNYLHWFDLQIHRQTQINK